MSAKDFVVFDNTGCNLDSIISGNSQSFLKKGLLSSQKKKKRVARIETIGTLPRLKKFPHNKNQKLPSLPLFKFVTLTPFFHQQGKTTYILGDINSITIQNNLIYDLLSPVFSSTKPSLKCKCSQSRCLARYCECFAKGLPCGIQCSCQNCGNKLVKQANLSQPTKQKGCNCKKSGCQKKYCQCLKQGKSCGPLCQCKGCLNP